MNSQPEQYQDFASDSCRGLTEIQNEFIDKYSINNYTNWYYTQATAILRLYSEEEEVFFKYVSVGTYSRNSNTWMWGWANKNSVEPGKLKTLEVKRLGEQLNYEELTKGHFKGDHYIGWELTSISFHLLGGIGTYRVVSDDLEIYFILTNVVDKAVVEELESELVECASHGKMRVAFVCQHLNNSIKTGFEEAFHSYKGMELDEDDDFQAWCDDCEIQRLKSGGWNDESMKYANIKIVCEGCYFVIKEFNEK